MGMERISSAILDKVKAEAQEVVKEAELRAEERVERAQKQRETKLSEAKSKLLEEASEEATRLLAQSAIKSRQELLLAKTRVINEIIDKVKTTLSSLPSNQRMPLNLIEEATAALDTEKVRIYVSSKDLDAVQKSLKERKSLSDKIAEVKEIDISGGIIAEDTDGKIRIDNSYETRLEMLLPQLLPEIGKELFRDM